MSEIPVDAEEIRRRFVQVIPAARPSWWRVMGQRGGRRSQEVGKAVCNVNLRHAPGFELVLLFPGGKMDSFRPDMLCPAEEPEVAT